MLSYQGGDSTSGTFNLRLSLGIRLNFYMDVMGGGSSTEALVGIAIGLIEAGCCKLVAIFRSMNGYSQVRIGGTGARSAAPVGRRHAAHPRLWLAERGTELRADLHAPHVRVTAPSLSKSPPSKCPQHHASNNPEGLLQEALHDRGRAEQPLQSASRFICWDCCVETDNATAIIVTIGRAAPATASTRWC